MTDGSGTDQDQGRQTGDGSVNDLALMARLRRFRRDHPTAEIITEHVRLDDTTAVFRATIAVPDGGRATGYGSTSPASGASFVEQAEWRAISRALTVLGFNPMLIEETPAPAATAPEHVPARVHPIADRAADTSTPTSDEEESARTPPTREPEPGRGSQTPPTPVTRRTPPPVELDPARERGSRPPLRNERPTPVRAIPKPQPINSIGPSPNASVNPSADPDLADYSFTAFWKWARELGYNSKGAIEELIGQSMTGLSPLELRRRVLAAQGDDDRGD